MHEFKREKDILAGEKDAWEAFEMELGRKCDWNDPEDVALYRSDVRLADRDRVLKKIGNRCPRCMLVKTLSSAWVIRERKAVCKSCFQKGEVVGKKMNFCVFSVEKRYVIDGLRLSEVRESCGLSRSEFARKAGWSRQYQRKLEENTETVGLDTAKVILEVLQTYSIQTLDDLGCNH